MLLASTGDLGNMVSAKVLTSRILQVFCTWMTVRNTVNEKRRKSSNMQCATHSFIVALPFTKSPYPWCVVRLSAPYCTTLCCNCQGDYLLFWKLLQLTPLRLVLPYRLPLARCAKGRNRLTASRISVPVPPAAVQSVGTNSGNPKSTFSAPS